MQRPNPPTINKIFVKNECNLDGNNGCDNALFYLIWPNEKPFFGYVTVRL